MTRKQNRQFYFMVKKIIDSEEFKTMANHRHHIQVSTYEHCLKVAYLCYRYHIKHNSKVNIKELVRAALLHDYFLYDRIDKTTVKPKNRFVHVFCHPSIALNNATAQYRLSIQEQDAIRKHMFPIVPIPPTSKCGWLVCFYDKVAAVGDYFNREKWKQELLEYCPEVFKKPQYKQRLKRSISFEKYMEPVFINRFHTINN